MLDELKAYKTPELQAIEAKMTNLQRDIQSALKAIAAGDTVHDGQLPVIKLACLLDQLRVTFADWTGANNQQEAYQRFIAQMEEAMHKRVNAIFAQSLVMRLRQMQDDLPRLNQIAGDDGASAVGFYSGKAREAGLPADVVNRVTSHVNAQMDALNEAMYQAVADDYNASRQPDNEVPA